MLYTEADRSQAIAEQAKRRLIVFAPAALLLLAAIASFVWFRLQRDAGGWIWTALLTILAGGYFLFLYEVYLRPVSLYRRHVEYMLFGRLRETVGTLRSIEDTPCDQNGLDCHAVLVNTGETDDPKDNRLFYLHALKTLPGIVPGERVRLMSNDRMIAVLERYPKEN